MSKKNLLSHYKRPDSDVLCKSCCITKSYTNDDVPPDFAPVSNKKTNIFLLKILDRIKPFISNKNLQSLIRSTFDINVDNSPYRIKILGVLNDNIIHLEQIFLHNEKGRLIEYSKRKVIITLN